MNASPASPHTANRWLVETHWSIIHSIRDGGGKDRDDALEKFCLTYWPPIYSFIRMRGHSQQDAEDLSQDYFCRLLKKGTLEKAFQEKGRLRDLIRRDIKFYLRDEWVKGKTLKRGGSSVRLSIDHETSNEMHKKLSTEATPDEAFDKSWGLVLLNTAVQRMEEQFTARERAHIFVELRRFLSPDDDPHYGTVAKTLNMKVTAVRAAVHRMRGEFRRILYECVSKTVGSEAEVLDEMRYLQRLFST